MTYIIVFVCGMVCGAALLLAFSAFAVGRQIDDQIGE